MAKIWKRPLRGPQGLFWWRPSTWPQYFFWRGPSVWPHSLLLCFLFEGGLRYGMTVCFESGLQDGLMIVWKRPSKCPQGLFWMWPSRWPPFICVWPSKFSIDWNDCVMLIIFQIKLSKGVLKKTHILILCCQSMTKLISWWSELRHLSCLCLPSSHGGSLF